MTEKDDQAGNNVIQMLADRSSAQNYAILVLAKAISELQGGRVILRKTMLDALDPLNKPDTTTPNALADEVRKLFSNISGLCGIRLDNK